MLKCREVSEQMSEYIDGEVTPLQRGRLAFHLLMCGHCRRFFHQMRLVTRTIAQREQADLELDEAHATDIVRKIQRTKEHEPTITDKEN